MQNEKSNSLSIFQVIQRRMDGSVGFNRDFETYKGGFGDKNGEYWLGEMNIYWPSSRGSCSDYHILLELSLTTTYLLR